MFWNFDDCVKVDDVRIKNCDAVQTVNVNGRRLALVVLRIDKFEFWYLLNLCVGYGRGNVGHSRLMNMIQTKISFFSLR